MAYRGPAAIKNENFHIHTAKDVDLTKTALSKPVKTGRQERRALKDLSNTGNPPASIPSKSLAPKEKTAIRGRGTINVKNAAKSTSLTEEEMKKCQEWAKEGIEHVHFTGNNLQDLHKKTEDERVNKKVMKVMSDLHEWLNASYDRRLLKKELPKNSKGTGKKMELETEVLPSITESPMPGYKEIDNLKSEPGNLSFLEELIELGLKEDSDAVFSFLEEPIELELKEDSNSDSAVAVLKQ